MPLIVRTPGLVLTEHTLTVPLDHDHPEDGRRIEIFAREVADPEGIDKPLLVYLQGGPGFEAPRPKGGASAPGWLERALKDFRVLMLDQRGTGRSTPVGPATLEGLSPIEQAEYLTHFRADAIVRDAEALRESLEVERWSVLGQSFGGFCVVTYLSIAPGGLREALITGGVPPLRTPIAPAAISPAIPVTASESVPCARRLPSARSCCRAATRSAGGGCDSSASGSG
jgi:pimeloyl-ACP methyl ester carboxylesterase